MRVLKAYADPLICAIGSLIAVPCLFIVIMETRTLSSVLFWFLTSIAITAICLSWTMVADMLLYVIHPDKRSIASALNILITHLLGDACSPYVIGKVLNLKIFLILWSWIEIFKIHNLSYLYITKLSSKNRFIDWILFI